MKTIIAIALSALAFGCAAPDATTVAAREQRRSEDKARRAAEDERKSWNGTLTAADGTVLPLRIEKKFGRSKKTTGSLAATNRISGEYLQGTWTAMMQSHSSMIYINGQWGTSNGGPPAGAGMATLRGDKGTTMQFQITVIGGWSPHGIGTGTDGHGKPWQLEF